MNVTPVSVLRGFLSLVVGLRITLREFFKPTVTLLYPHQSLPMAKRFRGHVELTRDPQTGIPACVACKLCERACPSACIRVEGAKAEGASRRAPTLFSLDFTLCSLCGACVEACKSQALRYSRDYNLAGFDKAEFHYDLLKRGEAKKA
ncbi:MAG: NADH-quinone oxidoreductase subunit I [Planctomycetota bacterium]